VKADRGWKREFEEPIQLPRGRQIVTLQDAVNYIMKLPKAEQNLTEWQTAIACRRSSRKERRMTYSCWSCSELKIGGIVLPPSLPRKSPQRPA
jgi:hypothetical protein